MRRVPPDLPAISGARAAREEALPAVDLADRVQHRERRLVARALGDLGLRGADPRVALEQPVREVPPAHALADERDLGLGLHRHLRARSARRRGRRVAPESSRERRPAVAEDPGVAVLIRADRPGEPSVGERSREHVLGRRVARVLEVVLDPVDRRPGLGVLDLEPGNHERSRSVRAEDERDRPLGRDEREAGVVEDVVRVEEHDPGESPLPAPRRAARRTARGAPRARSRWT